eukprot:PhF_6_TR17114/c0_g1_i6/m.26392
MMKTDNNVEHQRSKKPLVRWRKKKAKTKIVSFPNANLSLLDNTLNLKKKMNRYLPVNLVSKNRLSIVRKRRKNRTTNSMKDDASQIIATKRGNTPMTSMCRSPDVDIVKMWKKRMMRNT